MNLHQIYDENDRIAENCRLGIMRDFRWRPTLEVRYDSIEKAFFYRRTPTGRWLKLDLYDAKHYAAKGMGWTVPEGWRFRD